MEDLLNNQKELSNNEENLQEVTEFEKTEQTENTEEQPKQESEQSKNSEPEVKKPRAQKRIEQLLEKNKEAEADRKKLEEKLKYYENLHKPNAEKYEDDDEYEIDRQAYIMQKAQEKQDREYLHSLRQKNQDHNRRIYEETSQDFYKKIDAANEDTKNYIRKNASLHKARSSEIEIDIMDSDYAAEIFEVILRDVDRFNGMSDTRFIKEVAKIEAKFENGNKAIKPPISVPNPPTKLDQGNSGAQAKKNTNPLWGSVSFAQARKMG